MKTSAAYLFVSNNPVKYIDPYGLYEVMPNTINCIGHATEMGGSLQPKTDSLKTMMEALDWNCVDSVSSECDCDCDDEMAFMLYVYIQKADNWYDDGITDEGRITYINNVQAYYAGENFWEGAYWSAGENEDLDFHGIKRDCDSDNPETKWNYVPQHMETGEGGTYNIGGTLSDADDYWKNNYPERVLMSKCCKKRR